MFDTENFIAQIRARECIWNSGKTTYYNKKLKNQAWIEVCKVVDGDHFAKLSAKDKKEKIYLLKKKWKHIRDQFKKYYNKPQACDSEETLKVIPKPYIYSDLLVFLIPVLKYRKNPNDPEDEVQPNHNEDKIEHFLGSSSKRERENNEELVVPFKRHKNVEELKLIEERQIQQCPSNIEEDADKLFLLSLLPQIRQLNSDQKNYLYIEFLQTVQKAKYYTSPQINMEPHQFYNVAENDLTDIKPEIITSTPS